MIKHKQLSFQVKLDGVENIAGNLYTGSMKSKSFILKDFYGFMHGIKAQISSQYSNNVELNIYTGTRLEFGALLNVYDCGGVHVIDINHGQAIGRKLRKTVKVYYCDECEHEHDCDACNYDSDKVYYNQIDVYEPIRFEFVRSSDGNDDVPIEILINITLSEEINDIGGNDNND